MAFEVGEETARQRIPLRINAFVTAIQTLAAGATALTALAIAMKLRRRTLHAA